MMDNGLREYAETIASGIWPSLDVLPNIEKQQTGKPRKEESFSFKTDIQ
jgi:hypothetical protein